MFLFALFDVIGFLASAGLVGVIVQMLWGMK